MQKLSWSWILPSVNLIVAVTLIQFSYRAPLPRYLPVSPAWTACRAINAPAVLFSSVAHYVMIGIGAETPGEGAPREALGFHMDDLLFLAGVILVWHLIGRALDARRELRGTGTRTREEIGIVLLFSSLQVVSGALLLYMGVHDLQYPVSNYASIGALLILAWALLFLFGGMKCALSARLGLARNSSH